MLLSRLIWNLVEPGNLLIVLLVAGIALCWAGRDRIGRPLVIGSAAAMVVLLLLPVGEWLAMPLEARFPRLPLPRHVDEILVLGNGLDPEIYESRGAVGENPGPQRLMAGVALARRFPQAKLVFSGGSGKPFGGDSEANVARGVFAELGVPAGQIVLEVNSRTTWENLLFTKQLVRPKAGETWILVTSAVHLPRAMAVARHLGWKMIPWPSSYISPARADIFASSGYAGSVDSLEGALHEWMGLAAYRLEGRTDRLLP